MVIRSTRLAQYARSFFHYSQRSAESFWEHYPACLYGLFFFLGSQYALGHSKLLVIPAGFLSATFFARPGALIFFERFVLACAMALIAYYLTFQNHPSIEVPAEGLQGEGVFEIDSLAKRTRHFGENWIYKGKLHFRSSTAHGDVVQAKNLAVSIQLPQKAGVHRPPADVSYSLTGTVKANPNGNYTFRPAKEEPWRAIQGTWSLAEKRYWMKKSIADIIHRSIPVKRNGVFLSGIATGDFDDRLMSYEMGRFGLQHIMAISGFHFSIFAALLQAIFRSVFPKRTTVILMGTVLSAYFCFLGCSASVMRAWIMILIPLAGVLLQRNGSGVNSLGVALLVILFYDPLLGNNLGFQFSFLTTAGILLLFPGCDLLMQNLFPKRSLADMVAMSRWDQHAYCFLAGFRQAVALSIAVNAVALPLMLVYFQKFPLMSLVYNLFFPFMVSGSLLLLFFGLFFGCFSEIAGGFFHAINNAYTGFLLDLAYNLPPVFDCVLRMQAFPPALLLTYLSLLLGAGMLLHYYFLSRKGELEDYNFM